MTRLLLCRPGTTGETRRGLVPSTSGAHPAAGCPPLDVAGRTAAAALAAVLPPVDRVLVSHAVRARGTAAAAVPGLPAVATGDLAGCDLGTWAGRSLADLLAEHPGDVAAWRADPTWAGHGGEARTALRDRARGVLASVARTGGATLAIAHGDLVRAAVAEVLGAGDAALWAIDVAPGSVTELTWSGTWRVARVGWTPALRGAAAPAPARPVAGAGA